MHYGHSQLSSRATTESLTKTVFEYVEQIEIVLQVNTDVQQYNITLTFEWSVGLDGANANKKGPDKVQRMSDKLADVVDIVTNFLVGEAIFIIKRDSPSVATIFIPTAFKTRFKLS